MSIIETAIKKRRQLLKGKRFDHDKARWESFLEYCKKHNLNIRYIDWLCNVAR